MAALIVLAVDPTLAALGQIAAIIILLFAFIFILLFLAVNLATTFAFSWLQEKANMIKMLRPSVDSVNKASESAIQGTSSSQNENAVVRAVATIPAQVHNIDTKVVQVNDKVVNAAIEFRARAVQAKTIAQTFLFPGSMKRERDIATSDNGLEFNSPGYRMLMEQNQSARTTAGSDNTQAVTANQLKDAATR